MVNRISADAQVLSGRAYRLPFAEDNDSDTFIDGLQWAVMTTRPIADR